MLSLDWRGSSFSHWPLSYLKVWLHINQTCSFHEWNVHFALCNLTLRSYWLITYLMHKVYPDCFHCCWPCCSLLAFSLIITVNVFLSAVNVILSQFFFFSFFDEQLQDIYLPLKTRLSAEAKHPLKSCLLFLISIRDTRTFSIWIHERFLKGLRIMHDEHVILEFKSEHTISVILTLEAWFNV